MILGWKTKTSCSTISVANSCHSIDNKNSEHGSLFFYLRQLLPVVVLGLSILHISGCAPAEQRQSLVFAGPVMGTDFRITVVAEPGTDRQALSAQLQAQMEQVNQLMSHYLDDSEVSRFNRMGQDETIVLSEPVADVISQSLQISRQSDGYFDITVGALVNAWGFGPDGRIEKKPSDLELADLQRRSGFRKLVLEQGRLSKTEDGVTIDLSAIAKGYAVDQVAALLLGRGYPNFLIDIGGELRGSGRNADNQVWRVGIERPQTLGGIQQIVRLTDKAIATSGDYRNFLVLDGERFSHTIDPTTGRPVLHKLALVSVISDRASTADALATALMAMGEKKALALAEKEKIAAYLIIRNAGADEYTVHVTTEFAPYLL